MFTAKFANKGHASLIAILLVVAAFAVMVALTGMRIQSELYPGPNIPNNNNFGFCDFFNGIYYPTQAFLDGNSPYSPDVVVDYPMSRQVPFFSPAVFIAHSPVVFLSKQVAAVLYFVFLIFLTLLMAWMAIWMSGRKPSLFWVLLIGSVVLMTRPGHNSMFNGYFTLQLAIGSVLAIHYPRRSTALAALGLVIASFKPTFAIPLFVIMIAQGYWRPAILGAFVSTVLALGGLMWIAGSPSITEVIAIGVEAQSAHHEFTDLWPINTWTRLDAVAVFAKWFAIETTDSTLLTIMMVLLLLPCILVRKLLAQPHESDDYDSAAGPIGLICMLAMLVSIYHHFYDAMLLIVPIVGLLFRKDNAWNSIAAFHRWILLILISMPFTNYLSSRSAIRLLELEGTPFQVITSINGVCLVIALTYLCILTIRNFLFATSRLRYRPNPNPLIL